MFQKIKDKFNALVEKAKVWCKDSVTILWARIQIFVGIVLGALSAMDFTSFATFDWSSGNWKTLAFVALGVIVNGFITEMARRRTLNS